jgi:quercetin dioxygenase-like cupin family protein
MEIIVSTVEVPPGASGVLHTHPGEEAYYVLDGTSLLLPDGKTMDLNAGKGKPMTTPVK